MYVARQVGAKQMPWNTDLAVYAVDTKQQPSLYNFIVSSSQFAGIDIGTI